MPGFPTLWLCKLSLRGWSVKLFTKTSHSSRETNCGSYCFLRVNVPPLSFFLLIYLFIYLVTSDKGQNILGMLSVWPEKGSEIKQITKTTRRQNNKEIVVLTQGISVQHTIFSDKQGTKWFFLPPRPPCICCSLCRQGNHHYPNISELTGSHIRKRHLSPPPVTRPSAIRLGKHFPAANLYIQSACTFTSAGTLLAAASVIHSKLQRTHKIGMGRENHRFIYFACVWS